MELLEEKPVVDWLKTNVDYLIGGDSLNLVGLDGSGRSLALRAIAEALNPSDWTPRVWTPRDLTAMKRREIRGAIDSLYHPDRIPVLLVDDFGEFLMTREGRWVEQLLFSKASEAAPDDRPPLRCVVVTHPRDDEIVGLGSGLRERARAVHPPAKTPTDQEIAPFGCSNAEELLLLTGYNKHLLNVSGATPDARRGAVRSKARELLPGWVGQLGARHQKRLGAILSQTGSSKWQQNNADPSLLPLVVPKRSESSIRCTIAECVQSNDIEELLIGHPWPDRDMRAAVNRFRARCGNDPNPLWVDNFLSDTRLDFARLVEFLRMILLRLPSATRIRILSRDWVGKRVHPADILSALQQAGMSAELEERLHWRLYDQRDNTNLHRRELILSTRLVAFNLPPARIIIGQDSAGNETDGEVEFSSTKVASEAWEQGIDVVGRNR